MWHRFGIMHSLNLLFPRPETPVVKPPHDEEVVTESFQASFSRLFSMNRNKSHDKAGGTGKENVSRNSHEKDSKEGGTRRDDSDHNNDKGDDGTDSEDEGEDSMVTRLYKPKKQVHATASS
jgi:hypothetical protein